MKQLLIIAVIGLSVIGRAYADCNVTLRAKTATAKNAKLDGVSFSAKQIDALGKVCNVKIEQMGREELVADYIATLDRKLAKQAVEKTK